MSRRITRETCTGICIVSITRGTKQTYPIKQENKDYPENTSPPSFTQNTLFHGSNATEKWVVKITGTPLFRRITGCQQSRATNMFTRSMKRPRRERESEREKREDEKRKRTVVKKSCVSGRVSSGARLVFPVRRSSLNEAKSWLRSSVLRQWASWCNNMCRVHKGPSLLASMYTIGHHRTTGTT